MAQENQEHRTFVGECGEAAAVASQRLLQQSRFIRQFVCASVGEISRPSVSEDERKGHPPNEIICDAVQRKGPWQLLGPERLDHAEWTEDLSKKPDQHDWPMSHGIKGGDGIADAVNAHDHSDALPELRVIGLRHVQPIKNCPRK